MEITLENYIYILKREKFVELLSGQNVIEFKFLTLSGKLL